MKLALAIIAKDQVEQVSSIYCEYSRHFDSVVVAVDQRFEEFKKLEKAYSKLKVVQYEWSEDEKSDGFIHFDRKRNWLVEQLDCDYYFRLDTDDRIANPDEIRPVAEKAKQAGISVVYCLYEYSRDINGVVNAAHWRETIIKKSENLRWNKHIHENVICSDMSTFRMHMEDSIRLIHDVNDTHADESCARNIKYLLTEFKKDGAKTDPRTIAYLGRTFLATGNLDQAKFFLVKHITASGWDEDRYMSRVQLAEVHKQLGEMEEAKLCCFEAMDERPDYPDAYLKLSEVYFDQQNWEKTIHWGEIGVKTPTPRSMTLIDPSSYTWRPALILAYSYFMLDNYEKANQLFKYVKKTAPNIEFVKSNSDMFEKAEADYNFVKSFIHVLSYIKSADSEKVKHLFDALPKSLDDNAHIATLRNRHLPVKKWEKGSVVIFCPKSLEKWADPSVESGIGGSEEAVIYMARELTKLGKKVTVYNGCEDMEGVYNGVTYLSNHRFNPRDEFDTIISWRTSIYAFPIKGQNRWVWLHDVPPTVDFPKSHIQNLDKILVLSEYQKSLLPKHVPADKVFVSSNGINTPDFEELGVERNPRRCIYASSYDRGLEYYLKLWPEVLQAIPDAELHIYYGWNNIDKLIRDGDMTLKAFKDKMLKLMDQPGVFEHGRVGHKQLNEEYQKAGLYTYPSSFQEISCIAAMKAQANGCVPITTNYAALMETVKSGVKVNGSMEKPETQEEYKKQLIRALRDTTHQEALRKQTAGLKEAFSWGAVAQIWVYNMAEENRAYIEDRLLWIKSQCKRTEKIVDIGGNDGHTFDGWNRDNITTVDIDLYDIPNFVRANAEELPLADKSFDVAVLAEILEHVENPVQALKEARRVAKRVIVTVPYEHEWDEELLPFHGIDDHAQLEGMSREELAKRGNPKCKEFYTKDDYQHLYHVRHYTKDSLEEHLKLAGFENYEVKKMVSGKWVWYSAICS